MKHHTLFCSQCGSPYTTDGTREHVYCPQCGHKNPGKPLFESGNTSGKIRVISCPSCGADVLFKDDSGTAVCEYCGSTLMEDRTVIVNKYIDETKIKEAEAKERLRLKELEHEKEMADRIEKQDEENARRSKKLAKAALWFAGGFGYAAFIVWAIAEHNGESYSFAETMLIFLAVMSLLLAFLSGTAPVRNSSHSQNRYSFGEPGERKETPVETQSENKGGKDIAVAAGKIIGGIAVTGAIAGLIKKLLK